MPSDVRAEVCKLKSTMKTISEQNRQLCDSNAYYQKQDAAGNAQMQMALGTISLVLAPYAGLALAGGGTMAGMTGAALGTNAGIGLAIGGFDYNEAYTGKNPVKDFLGENTYEDVRTISNLVSGETVIAGASGVQAIEDARRADEIGKISQNAKVADDEIFGEGNNSRPTWRQSELDAAEDFPDYDAQKSFVNGEEVPYGTKGSVRPDYYKDGFSVDIKNYNIESTNGRNNLVRNIEKQYYQRIDNLPKGTKQTIMIDVRGQNVSDTALNALYNDIMQRMNNDVEIMFKMY